MATILLVAFVAIAYQAWHVGITVDEPSHLTSAYLYWHGQDRLYPRDMPPLIKIFGGLAPRMMGLPLPKDLGHPGDKRTEWDQGATLMHRLPPKRLQQVVFWSRLPLCVFPLFTTLILWRWARALHGPVVAVIVAFLWVFSPTPLAHSAFLKNDLTATCTYVIFWFTAWRYWREPGIWRALAFSAGTGLVVLSKMSMLFLLVVAPLLLFARLALKPRPGRRVALVSLAFLVLVPYLIVVSAYQFELHWAQPAELSALAKDVDIPGAFVAVAHLFQWIPVPEGIWVGVISLFKANSHFVPVYLLGQVYPEGSRFYFVVAMLLKFPLAVQALFLGGLYLLVRAALQRRWSVADALWIVPGFLYLVLASMASLHMGIRLMLPSWPFLLLIAGLTVAWLLRSHRRQAILAALVALFTMRAVQAFPNGLSFFNSFAGPPENALRFLADSNIDWGQALPELGSFVRERKIDKIHVSYFGFDNSDRYFAPGVIEPFAPPWSENLVKTDRYQPAPGWYAVSASLLPGHFFWPKYRDYYAEFRLRRPTAVVGGSIFVYHIE